jgi:hypothetical protein
MQVKLEDKKYYFVGNGPQKRMWRAQYVLCPYCKTLLLKGKNKEPICKCGNIDVCVEDLRLYIKSNESEIPTFNEYNDLSKEMISYEQIINGEYKIKKSRNNFIKIEEIKYKQSILTIILEDYKNCVGITNLYILKNKKLIYIEIPSKNNYFTNFSYTVGNNYFEAITLESIEYIIDLDKYICSKRMK